MISRMETVQASNFYPQLSSVSNAIREAVPKKLRDAENWIVWASQASDKEGGKPKKMPMKLMADGAIIRGNISDIKTHMSFHKALELYTERKEELSGLGFVFIEGDGFMGLDFDQCINEKGEIEGWAIKMMTELDTYTEYSPSGTGFHCIVEANEIGTHKCKSANFHDAKFEMYSKSRFFTVTGDVIGEPKEVAERSTLVSNYSDQIELASGASIAKPKLVVSEPIVYEPGSSVALMDDDELLKTIRGVASSKKMGSQADYFIKLHDLGFINEDKSSDDMRYFNALAFYSGKDKAQMERVYLQSKLVRDKSAREGYLEQTISKAISGCWGTYKKPLSINSAERLRDLNLNTKATSTPIILAKELSVISTPTILTEEMKKVKKEIIQCSRDVLGIKPGRKKAEGIKFNDNVLEQMLTSSFWSSDKSKFYLLGNGDVLSYPESSWFSFLDKACGKLIDPDALKGEVTKIIQREGGGSAKKIKILKEIQNVLDRNISGYVKYYSQRDKIEMRVDMFAERGRVNILDEKAQVIFPHTPFKGPYTEVNKSIVNDFKEHFTRLDELLNFIVMSRFSADRKKSYLWILADSDWGKGFLLGILNHLKMSVELSVKEVEKIFEGSPVGRCMGDFKRAFALVVDEFKMVKSELKQLQNNIDLSPKYQLNQSVEVYAKIFLSAESVGSLVGESGVEDQFANRFSIFKESGSLDRRTLYKEVGGSEYFNQVASYVADFLNKRVAYMVALGEAEARKVAGDYLTAFIDAHGLDKMYERLSATLPDIVTAIKEWIVSSYIEGTSASGRDKSSSDFIKRHALVFKGKLYLKSPAKVIYKWIEMFVDPSEMTMIKRKKDVICVGLSEDGNGMKSCKIAQATHRVVLLNSNFDEERSQARKHTLLPMSPSLGG